MIYNFLRVKFIYLLVLFSCKSFELEEFDYPLLNTSKIKIMPLGDSITQGIHINSKNIGYRRDLYNLLKSNGYQIDLVGSMHDGSVSDFDKDHEGHGGYRADQIRDSVYYWLSLNPPDIILLHVGTNDISQKETAYNVSLEIDQILDQIDLFELDNDYRIKVIVAKIINHFDYQENVITLNNYISSNVEDRFKDGDYIFLADIYSSLNDKRYFLDNVHPNESGYKVMAETWASKI